MAWRFAADPTMRRWALYSLSIGLIILVCFVASNMFSVLDATHALPDAPTGLVQRISIISGWTWIAMVALHAHRSEQAQHYYSMSGWTHTGGVAAVDDYLGAVAGEL
jgi:hypothetical protein